MDKLLEIRNEILESILGLEEDIAHSAINEDVPGPANMQADEGC